MSRSRPAGIWSVWASVAAGRGVQIILGNAQAPGRPAPELAAEHWPTADDPYPGSLG